MLLKQIIHIFYIGSKILKVYQKAMVCDISDDFLKSSQIVKLHKGFFFPFQGDTFISKDANLLRPRHAVRCQKSCGVFPLSLPATCCAAAKWPPHTTRVTEKEHGAGWWKLVDSVRRCWLFHCVSKVAISSDIFWWRSLHSKGPVVEGVAFRRRVPQPFTNGLPIAASTASMRQSAAMPWSDAPNNHRSWNAS